MALNSLSNTRGRDTALPRSWLAVQGKSPDAVLSELRLRVSRVPGDDTLKFQIVGANSDDGWYLIVARGRDHRLIREPVIKRLSAGCEVLTCTVEEESVFSAASAWRDERRVWSVTYNGEDGPADVVAEGDLPRSYSAIRDRFAAEARAEDADDALVDPMLEIPVEIVHGLTGYKPRDASRAFAGRFALLEGLDTPWLTRMIFGG